MRADADRVCSCLPRGGTVLVVGMRCRTRLTQSSSDSYSSSRVLTSSSSVSTSEHDQPTRRIHYNTAAEDTNDNLQLRLSLPTIVAPGHAFAISITSSTRSRLQGTTFGKLLGPGFRPRARSAVTIMVRPKVHWCPGLLGTGTPPTLLAGAASRHLPLSGGVPSSSG